MYHYTTRYSELIGHLDNYPINFTYGYMGVTVFFVLSGFLTVYHMRDKNGGVENYFANRFRRLYPAYWVAMILTTIVSYFFLSARCVSPLVFLTNLTMLQYFVFVPSIDGSYWTLCIALIVSSVLLPIVEAHLRKRAPSHSRNLLWFSGI